jgi:hypothetical protein
LVIKEPGIREAITDDDEAKSPIITPVVAETANYYVLPAPGVEVEEMFLDVELWDAKKVFEYKFVIVPKEAVSVATVIGSRAKPKGYDHFKRKRTRAELRHKMKSSASPSITPKR